MRYIMVWYPLDDSIVYRDPSRLGRTCTMLLNSAPPHGFISIVTKGRLMRSIRSHKAYILYPLDV